MLDSSPTGTRRAQRWNKRGRKKREREGEKKRSKMKSNPNPRQIRKRCAPCNFPTVQARGERGDVWLRADARIRCPSSRRIERKETLKKLVLSFPSWIRASSTWPAGSFSFTSHRDLRSDLEFLPRPCRRRRRRTKIQKLIAD